MKKNIIILLLLLFSIVGYANTDTSKVRVPQTVKQEKNIITEIFQTKQFEKFLDLLDDSVFFFVIYDYNISYYYYPKKEIIKAIDYIYNETNPTRLKVYITDNNYINVVLYNNELLYPTKLTFVFNKKIDKIYLRNEKGN
jgi:hypothetical protein